MQYFFIHAPIIPCFPSIFKKICLSLPQSPLFLDFPAAKGYNHGMQIYEVKKFIPKKDAVLTPQTPASKSILNRALLLAALAKGDVTLLCGGLSEDTRAMLDCLETLGVQTEQITDGILVHGCGGAFPVRTASLDVRSAGTAARFLTVALAFAGGDYTLTASPQMQKRPMDVLGVLEDAGISIDYFGERGHFPFRMRSNGLNADVLTVNTDLSTQYASGIILAAACIRPVTLRLTGSRTRGSYIQMTLALIRSFGAAWERTGDTLRITPAACAPAVYEVENDLSGACYFYALALLFSTRVLVRRIHLNTRQGDLKFLRLLEEKGVSIADTPDGILADGRKVASFTGWNADMHDFSDQALTLAALAPFATSPTRIRGIGHIRRQECDRIRAMTENLNALGVPAEAKEDEVYIPPAPVRGGTVKTFDDHRVAMAFTLIGLKTGNVAIENPACTRKTFENFFDIITDITN